MMNNSVYVFYILTILVLIIILIWEEIEDFLTG